MAGYERIKDDTWYDASDKMNIACCDCGLVHSVEFRVGPGGQLQRRVKRNDRQTTLLRKEQKFPAAVA